MTIAPPADAPSSAFASRTLVTATIDVGRTWRRIYDDKHPDPLGFGEQPSRFSDPTGRAFGLIYGGSSAKGAFAEAILRDTAVGSEGAFPVEVKELRTKILATLTVVEPLTVIDLTGDNLLKMRMPTDIAHSRDHGLSRKWGEAMFSHSQKVDGVLFASRLNGELNLAIYDRALPKMSGGVPPKLMDCRDELAAIINDFDLAIV